jgi:hypothetical protein
MTTQRQGSFEETAFDGVTGLDGVESGVAARPIRAGRAAPAGWGQKKTLYKKYPPPLSFAALVVGVSIARCQHKLMPAQIRVSTTRCQHKLVSAPIGVSTDSCQHHSVSARFGVSTARCQHRFVSAPLDVSTNWCQHRSASARIGVSTARWQHELVSAPLGYDRKSPPAHIQPAASGHGWWGLVSRVCVCGGGGVSYRLGGGLFS